MYTNNTILLVDDDEDDREMLESALNSLKTIHKIVVAEDGIDCFVKLKELEKAKQLPCLIVLDINMPRMNGKQTLIKLKREKQYQNVPIVILSTSFSEEDRHFFSGRIVDYLQKPVKYLALCDVAKKILSHCEH